MHRPDVKHGLDLQTHRLQDSPTMLTLLCWDHLPCIAYQAEFHTGGGNGTYTPPKGDNIIRLTAEVDVYAFLVSLAALKQRSLSKSASFLHG